MIHFNIILLYYTPITDQVDVAVTLQICNLEAPASNSGEVTGHPD
jgi:hypothetical protein